MKYSEFKQRVLDIGFTVEDEAREVWVVDDEGDIVATVSTDITNSMDTDHIAFKEQGEDVRAEVLRLTYQLAKTPLAEREEEKRYWLRNIPVPLLKESDDLWYYEPINKLFKPGVDRDRTDNEKYKSIFTESEIAQMDITGFEKVEVTE